MIPKLRTNSADAITSAVVIHYRPMTMSDLGNVPIDCQGSEATVRSRIADLGASAILAFDGEQHVGQLQFRRYDQALRSPDGIMDPSYWGDFGQASQPYLPGGTLNLFCYHVGQLEAGAARDPHYHGRGIGVALLKEFLRWADATGVEATVAKALPPFRPLGVLMGGHRPRSTRITGSRSPPAGATATCATGFPTFLPANLATASQVRSGTSAIKGSLSTRLPKWQWSYGGARRGPADRGRPGPPIATPGHGCAWSRNPSR